MRVTSAALYEKAFSFLKMPFGYMKKKAFSSHGVVFTSKKKDKTGQQTFWHPEKNIVLP